MVADSIKPRYETEFFLEFRSTDRFLYRVSDLYELDQCINTDLRDRLDNCHIYLLGKRPRLSLVPDSVRISDAVHLTVEYRVGVESHRSDVEFPREIFSS